MVAWAPLVPATIAAVAVVDTVAVEVDNMAAAVGAVLAIVDNQSPVAAADNTLAPVLVVPTLAEMAAEADSQFVVEHYQAAAIVPIGRPTVVAGIET